MKKAVDALASTPLAVRIASSTCCRSWASVRLKTSAARSRIDVENAHSSVSIPILLRSSTKNYNGIEDQELMRRHGWILPLAECVIMGVPAQFAGLPLDPRQPIR
jgi:hypothetical protein